MKHIIIILLLPIFLTAQSDTIILSKLSLSLSIDTVDLGSTYKLTTTYQNYPTGQTVRIDTTADSDLTGYLDSIIALVQVDSITYGNTLQVYYNLYKEHNTYFQNAKRYLAKLWAIKP